MELTQPPERLIGPEGVRHGMFSGPLEDVDLVDLPLRVHGRAMPDALRRMRFKEWQHVALVLPSHLLSFAVVDTHYLKLAWFQVVDRATGERFEHARKSPFMKGHVARSLWSEDTFAKTRGFDLHIANRLRSGTHTVSVDIAGGRKGPALRGRITCHHDLDATTPLVVSLPLPNGRTMYSHKVPLPCEGELTIGGEQLRWGAGEGVAIFDVHKADYPHHTWWQWATFAGRSTDDQAVALNLTRNVVEDDRYHENALWLDGHPTLLSAPRFEKDPGDIMQPWTLSTDAGEVELRFIPEGYRSEKLNLGILASNFYQCFGRFEGRVTLPGRDPVELTEAYGVCEDHDSRW